MQVSGVERWEGYSGFLLEMIRATGAEIGDEVVVERPGGPRFRRAEEAARMLAETLGCVSLVTRANNSGAKIQRNTAQGLK
ncbi:MAG: hypothetical protein QXI52_06515 [Nitrososphaerota archaeon]